MTAQRVPPKQPANRVPVPPERLNVVLIDLDDGGAELFEWSGLVEPLQGFAKTPRLNELRALGVTLRRAYAPTICGPARWCAESGQYSRRTGTGTNYDGPEAAGFAGGVYGGQQTIRTLVQALGIATNDAYVSCWSGKAHLAVDVGQEGFPISLGYDRYVGCQSNANSFEDWPVGQLTPNLPGDPGYVAPAGNSGHFHYRTVDHNAGSAFTTETIGAGGTWPSGGPYTAWDPTSTPRAGYDAVQTFREGLEWANATTGPFFLKLCPNPPHFPVEVPPFEAPDDIGHGATGGTFRLVSPETEATLRTFGRGTATPGFRPSLPSQRNATFLATLELVDSLIGWFNARLDPAKRARTVFVLWGDNGTVAQCVAAPYAGDHGKRSPYEQGQRVPALIWSEHDVIAAKGRVCDHLAHIVDVFPTVLELAGCTPAQWNPGGTIPIDGRSLVPMLRNPSAPPARTSIYSELFSPLGAQHPGNPTGTPAIPSIDPTLWQRTYTDGTYKLIAHPQGAAPAYELYRITNELQPASGEPGYMERPQDDLYPLAIDGLHPTEAAILSQLIGAMQAEVAS